MDQLVLAFLAAATDVPAPPSYQAMDARASFRPAHLTEQDGAIEGLTEASRDAFLSIRQPRIDRATIAEPDGPPKRAVSPPTPPASAIID